MDCKTCRNYEPTIPDGIKTDELEIGMVLKEFYSGVPSKGFYVVVEKPTGKWLRVLSVYKGRKPRECEISLGDHGCQPYGDGDWSPTNYLREVTP